MLTTKKFIEKTRQVLFQTFPALEYCKYAFDQLSNTHYFLITEGVYTLKEFSEFDYATTCEAFDAGVQGLICFMTDDKMFDFSDQQVFYNSYNNEVILKNLANLIDPNDFFRFTFNLNDINSSFSKEDYMTRIEVSDDNNYALAA